MPSRSLQECQAKIAEQELQLRRLSEERARGVEEAVRARERARHEAQTEAIQLQAELHKVSEKVQRRTAELRACERKSVSMQIQAESLAAQLQAARARAGCDEAGWLESLQRSNGETAALQSRVQDTEQESLRATAACQKISVNSARASEKLLQLARAQQDDMRKQFKERESELHAEICKERQRKSEQTLLHGQQWKHKCQELEHQGREADEELSVLEVACQTLQTRTEATRGQWLAAERTRFAYADQITSAAAARDDAASKLQALLRGKSALVARISAQSHESEQRLQAELVSWRADRWHHSEETLQLQHQAKMELEEHRRRCAAELREGLAAVAAKSREQDSRTEQRNGKRVQACKRAEELRLANEERCWQERLGVLQQEATADATAQQRQEAIMSRRMQGLRDELTRAQQQAARWEDEEQALAAELRGFYEEDFVQLQGILRERGAELRSLERQLGEDELAQSSERRQLLAEIQSERIQAAQAAARPPVSPGIGIGGRSGSTLPPAATEHDDPFEDLPELPSIPDFPPDFGESGHLATPTGHDEADADAEAEAEAENGDVQLEVARLKSELAACNAEIHKLTRAATSAGTKLPHFRETEARLSEAEQERAALRIRHEELEEQVSQLVIICDSLQDWDNELRDALSRADTAADDSEARPPLPDVVPLDSTAAGEPAPAVDESSGVDGGSGINSERIAALEAELRACIEQNQRAKKALSTHLEQDSRAAEPLELAGSAKSLSPARALRGASDRYTPKQLSSQRRMREMQLRKQEADAKRDAERRSRLRVGWLLPPDAPPSS